MKKKQNLQGSPELTSKNSSISTVISSFFSFIFKFFVDLFKSKTKENVNSIKEFDDQADPKITRVRVTVSSTQTWPPDLLSVEIVYLHPVPEYSNIVINFLYSGTPYTIIIDDQWTIDRANYPDSYYYTPNSSITIDASLGVHAGSAAFNGLDDGLLYEEDVPVNIALDDLGGG